MLFDWEGNRWSSDACVTDAGSLGYISAYGLNSVKKGDEHPAPLLHSSREYAWDLLRFYSVDVCTAGVFSRFNSSAL